MKILMWIGIVTVSFLVLFFVFGAFLPASYHVERSQVIAAEPAVIHPLVNDLRHWSKWDPWQKSDPTVEIAYGEITIGEGAHQSWTADSGTGALAITASSPESGVTYDLFFDEGKYISQGAISYHITGEGTTVTWQMDGEMTGTIDRYFGLLMETMVGPEFENGLTNLKTVVESLPAL